MRQAKMEKMLKAIVIMVIIVTLGQMLVQIALTATSFEGYSKAAPQSKAPPQKKKLTNPSITIQSAFRVWTNPTDGSELVWIPGGEFYMGSNEGDPDERPVHRVRVEGFWLGRYEITNQQYAKFLQATGYPEKPDFWDDPKFNKPNQPVVGVKFHAALAYCRWAGLRLPTEAEWEYAAAAGAKQLRYGTATGEISHDLANFAGAQGRDVYDDAPAPVGKFPPNPFGLYDMAGNAWEWTSSLWRPYPYRADDGREDLEAFGFRVMRGGCWHFGPFHCRVSSRHRHMEHLRYDYVGFRVALSASEFQRRVSKANEPLITSLRNVYRYFNELPLSPEKKREGLVILNQFVRLLKSAGLEW